VKTRAALFTAADEPLAVREVELDPLGPEDVLVRMQAVGVCGSDLHVIRGEWQRPTPMVLGHEGSGVIEEVGAEVTGLEPGDRVIIHWAPSCGECPACLAGRPATCAKLRAAIGAGTLLNGTTGISYEGEPVYRMTAVGAFAQHVAVPARSIIPLPDEMSMEEAALIGCAALTGAGVVSNLLEVQPGAKALVVGAGGVGQFVIQALRIAGAEVIAVSDPSEQRREVAAELGATHPVAPEDLGALVEQQGGFEAVIEAVGNPATIGTAIEATRIGGTAALVGMAPTGTTASFDPFVFTAQEKSLVGSMYGSADPAVTAAGVLAASTAGEMDLARMLGPSFDLDQINEGIAVALAGDQGRTTILPNGPIDQE
jgi:S-(hydroxymethyl)glutathione dehydrogenase/alcohol dehydrogenase